MFVTPLVLFTKTAFSTWSPKLLTLGDQVEKAVLLRRVYVMKFLAEGGQEEKSFGDRVEIAVLLRRVCVVKFLVEGATIHEFMSLWVHDFMTSWLHDIIIMQYCNVMILQFYNNIMLQYCFFALFLLFAEKSVHFIRSRLFQRTQEEIRVTGRF